MVSQKRSAHARQQQRNELGQFSCGSPALGGSNGGKVKLAGGKVPPIARHASAKVKPAGGKAHRYVRRASPSSASSDGGKALPIARCASAKVKPAGGKARRYARHASSSSASNDSGMGKSSSSASSDGGLGQLRYACPSSASSDVESDDGGPSNVRRVIEVIDLTTSSTKEETVSPAARDLKQKKRKEREKGKEKEKVKGKGKEKKKAQGPVQKMWDLHNEIAALDDNISVLTDKLEKAKAKKKALQRALAEAHKKASKM